MRARVLYIQDTQTGIRLFLAEDGVAYPQVLTIDALSYNQLVQFLQDNLTNHGSYTVTQTGQCILRLTRQFEYDYLNIETASCEVEVLIDSILSKQEYNRLQQTIPDNTHVLVLDKTTGELAIDGYIKETHANHYEVWNEEFTESYTFNSYVFIKVGE